MWGGAFNKYSKITEGGHWGYVNSEGQIMIDLMYEKAFGFCEGVAAAKLNGKWGFIGTDGNIIVPFEYDHLYSKFEDAEGELVKDEIVYVFDKNGKQIRTYEQEKDDDYDDYEDDDTPSYSKYGGYNGYDDQTIDEAFGGDPTMTWNID